LTSDSFFLKIGKRHRKKNKPRIKTPIDQENHMSENAEMSYEPSDDNQFVFGGIKGAFAKAQSQLLSQPGVNGLGMTKTPTGQDVIVVYVKNALVIEKLPPNIDGFSVVGEVTGDIGAL
jgi:hypothetical protein